jgi:hypothetical protein
MNRLLLSIGQALLVFVAGILVVALAWAIVTGIYVLEIHFHQHWSVFQIIDALVAVSFLVLVAIYFRMNRA